MSQQTPYEQIRFINDAIKDRQDKNQATFFSVKLERFGALTPLATKQNGETFYETIIQYLTKYDMTAMVVELYNGKSHNVKDPFQTFKIIVKRNAELSGLADFKEDLKVSPTETVITSEKHFFSMAEKERQVMMLEFDLKRLQYEIEELKKKNKKKKNYIQELEAELGKTERDKKQSLGNVSLGMVGANALEGFAKSAFGIGILTKVFGMKPETLNGLLGTDGIGETQPANETKSVASLITSEPQAEQKSELLQQAVAQPLTKEQQKRQEVKKFIVEFLDSCPDATLRLYYELIQYLGSDIDTLQSVIQQIKSYRQQQQELIKQKINSAASNKTHSEQSHNKDFDGVDINDSS